MNRPASLSRKNKNRSKTALRSFPNANPQTKIRILKILPSADRNRSKEATDLLLRDFGNGTAFEFRLHRTDPKADLLQNPKLGWRTFSSFRKQIRQLAKEFDHIWITGACSWTLASIRSLPQSKVLKFDSCDLNSSNAILRRFGFYHAFCRELDAIVFPSDFTRNQALKIVPWMRNLTHVVRDGFPVSYENEAKRLRNSFKARQILDLPQEEFIVGTPETFKNRKQVDQFFEIAARIKNRLPNSFFVVCAPVQMKNHLRSRAKNLELEESIQFTDRIDDLKTNFQAWNLALFDSDFRSNQPMLAASHGCLIALSGRAVAIGDFLKDGETGIARSDRDPEKLVFRILEVAKDRVLANELRETAAEKLRVDYSPEHALHFYRSFFSS